MHSPSGHMQSHADHMQATYRGTPPDVPAPAPVSAHRDGRPQHAPGAAGSKSCPHATALAWPLQRDDTPSGQQTDETHPVIMGHH